MILHNREGDVELVCIFRPILYFSADFSFITIYFDSSMADMATVLWYLSISITSDQPLLFVTFYIQHRFTLSLYFIFYLIKPPANNNPISYLSTNLTACEMFCSYQKPFTVCLYTLYNYIRRRRNHHQISTLLICTDVTYLNNTQHFTRHVLFKAYCFFVVTLFDVNI